MGAPRFRCNASLRYNYLFSLQLLLFVGTLAYAFRGMSFFLFPLSLTLELSFSVATLPFQYNSSFRSVTGLPFRLNYGFSLHLSQLIQLTQLIQFNRMPNLSGCPVDPVDPVDLVDPVEQDAPLIRMPS